MRGLQIENGLMADFVAPVVIKYARPGVGLRLLAFHSPPDEHNPAQN